MEQCHDIGEEQRQDIGVGAATRGICHVHTEINPMSIRVLTGTKMIPQLCCATIHNAVFARKGAQCLITRMPLTQSICSEVDHHELGTMSRLDPM